MGTKCAPSFSSQLLAVVLGVANLKKNFCHKHFFKQFNTADLRLGLSHVRRKVKTTNNFFIKNSHTLFIVSVEVFTLYLTST